MVERLLVIGGLFVLAGLCEIGGGYLVWGWIREHKPLAWALLGALVLAACGLVAALQPISSPSLGGCTPPMASIHRAGARVGRGRRRVQAGLVGRARGSNLRGGRGSDGRLASGMKRHYSPKCVEG